MATASQVLAVAARELGYSRWDDPEDGTRYGRWYAQAHGAYFGASGVPYCAMFVSWVLAQAGATPPGGAFAYVPAGINAARAAGRLVTTRQAAPGDLACFDWDDDGVADHIGIVEVNHGSWVQTIEGNTSPGSGGSQGNGGGVYRRARSWDVVCAVIRPDYSGASAPASSVLAVDAWYGPATITRTQEVVGATPDGVVSGQSTASREYLVNIGDGWEFNDGGGSQMVAAIQARLGVDPDGYMGPVTISAWQERLGVEPDEYMGPVTVCAIQTALNRGGLW